jgi:hypothetical protein
MCNIFNNELPEPGIIFRSHRLRITVPVRIQYEIIISSLQAFGNLRLGESLRIEEVVDNSYNSPHADPFRHTHQINEFNRKSYL